MPDEKSKVLLVDYQNLLGMMNILAEKYNISKSEIRINFKKLINSSKASQDLCFLVLREPKSYSTFHAKIESAGFKIICPEIKLESGNSWDDQKINNLIKNYLSKSYISEIIIVSGDGGYLDNLSLAQFQDIKVTVMAIPEVLNEQYNFNENIRFVDLSKLDGLFFSKNYHDNMNFLNIYTRPWMKFIFKLSLEVLINSDRKIFWEETKHILDCMISKELRKLDEFKYTYKSERSNLDNSHFDYKEECIFTYIIGPTKVHQSYFRELLITLINQIYDKIHLLTKIKIENININIKPISIKTP